MGGDGGDAQGPGGVPPPGGATDHGDDGKRGAGGEWEYPSVVEAMENTGIHSIGVYNRRWKSTIAERVASRPIYELCTEAERIPGTIRLV